MNADGVRLRDLLGLDALHGACLVGDADGLDRLVTEVELVEPDTVLSARIRPGAAVLFAADTEAARPGGHLLDLVLRRAREAAAAGVLVHGPAGEIPAATRRLANRTNLPLVLVPPAATPLELAVELRVAVAAPTVEHGRVVHRLGRALHRPLEDLLHTLSDCLRAAVCVCTAHGVVVAGREPATDVAELVSARGLTSFTSGALSVAVLPIVGPAGATTLWLVAERERVGALWRRTAEYALAAVHGSLLAWLAREQLAAERDARLRGTLLSEILEHGGAVAPAVAEQAAKAGWRLTGWHLGIHLRFSGEHTASAAHSAEALAGELRATGLHLGPLVERADGWSTWITSAQQPPADHAHRVAVSLRDALRTLHGRGRRGVAAGVGAPQPDVPGIASTLAEARQAAVIAESSGDPLAVRVVQDLGASRLLLGWYSAPAFRDYAAQLLRPLLDADDPELFATLEAYLDAACSTMRTARALGIHRNTVGQRITRAERILGTSLTQPDTRLALQLALRAVRTGQAP
ncbi:helix-turn-helix domain-containing protein [Pseudonocardia acaciae]|uniref:helix-turn-helix domain-containing protein n=1 Tax=Pseudonocardia acaciae TaxID=551276 RepID=UPI00068525C8|nr:PucR family transcriptional regulator [Pseudonocardia acaciae]